MSYFLIFTTVFIGLITLLLLFEKWRHSYWKRRGVPQLEPEFFYGNVRGMIKGETSMAETFLDFYKQFKALGVNYGGVYIMYGRTFMAIDPVLIKDIMQKNHDHFMAHFPEIKNPTIFTKGLFHLREEPWRKTRRQLTPTFTSGKMKMMFETMLEKTTGLEELAAELVDSGEPVDIKLILGRFTIDVIGSCGFGIEINALKDPDSDFVKYGRMIFESPNENASWWKIFIRAVIRRGYDKNRLLPVENFFKKIVSDTLDYREKNKLYRKDFLQLMLQLKNTGAVTDDEYIFDKSAVISNASNPYDKDDITAQCLLFFVAGFDTSATTMTFALLELAQHQDIQEKVRQEANEIFNKYNGKMTYEAMMELTYTEQVIEETLRKYPPVASIPRACTKDYTIPGTNIVIEKDFVVIIPAWGLQMDPEYFPDPEKFDPERFSEENKKNIKEFTYMPFGEGPRMCLGLRFGMMQSKIGLVSLVRNYNFTLHENTHFPLKFQKNTFITSVKGNVWLNIEKVK